MKKRIVETIIAILIIFVSLPFSVLASEDNIVINIDATNAPRGANQTVLYNLSGSYTQTNEWGLEITVSNGFVSHVGGNNTLVPQGENSFVISAHGTAISALNGISVGMKAVFDAEASTITLHRDHESDLYIVNEARNAVISARDNAKKQCLTVAENAVLAFAAAEEKYSKLGQAFNSADAVALVNEYNRVALLYRERAVAEYRGIWVRPLQKNDAEVEAFVRKCVRAGINTISVEIIFDCTTICPMPEDSIFEHNPYFNGFDALDSFVRIGHKYGVEIYAWMHTYSISDVNSTNFSKSITAKNPEWSITSSENQLNPNFVNPASKEAREFLLKSYEYLLTSYNIDAFQLDTIRYPANDEGCDYGYDLNTVEAFKAEYPQYADSEIKFDKAASYWQDWMQFRAAQVSELVKQTRNLINRVSPSVLLSADVGAVLNGAFESRYQNASLWLDEGWLDIVHPMAYGENDCDNVSEFFNHINNNCLVVPALGAYVDGFDAETMLNQARDMTDIGCKGVGFFADEHFFLKGCDKLLGEYLYTSPAISPSLNCANTVVAEITRFSDRLTLAGKNNFMDAETQTPLLNLANSAIKAAQDQTAFNAFDTLNELKAAVTERIPESGLRDRLLLDINNALYAATLIKDDKYHDYISYNLPVPENASQKTQLTIDKINSPHIGEDSVLITNPAKMADYNVNYAYVMLLAPIENSENLYTLVEARHNYGTALPFETEITSGMVVISFHTDDFGVGAERRNLAKTVQTGTTLCLWGVDANSESFYALDAMLYVYDESLDVISGDVNLDGTVDMFDYLLAKAFYFETVVPTEKQRFAADMNSDGVIDMFDYLLIKTAYFNA